MGGNRASIQCSHVRPFQQVWNYCRSLKGLDLEYFDTYKLLPTDGSQQLTAEGMSVTPKEELLQPSCVFPAEGKLRSRTADANCVKHYGSRETGRIS